MEWLDDVVVRSGAQPSDALLDVRLGGEHDDRHARATAFGLANLLGGGVAVELWHRHVHEDQVRPRRARQLDARRAVGGDDHLVALLLEGKDQHTLDVEIVVDDEDLCGSHQRPLADEVAAILAVSPSLPETDAARSGP